MINPTPPTSAPTRPPTSPPTASDEDRADARDLPWTMLDHSIARYEESRSAAQRAEQLGAIDPRVQPWVEIAISEAIDAKYQLTRAIIATDPSFAERFIGTNGSERWRWPVRGVRSGTRTYLIMPDPDREDEEGGFGKPPLMKLVRFDQADVINLDPASSFAATIFDGMAKPVPPSPQPVPPNLESASGWLAMIREAIEIIGPDEAWRRIMTTTPKAER